ncbi:glutamate ABC transporter substrate-binding protein [Catenulispora sp. NL8]|uniref:Glutamate ABC transporter substrate-binding protein n=1 Tax=Catenulispora pinistramenti TaxID=2705254 RepID=A0ABS5L1V5_9ACTN|nr:glutamate ABC transporter substrate-binding protein [Catenulispora pinistramenti]MBS2552309.1 glutamate ABC transporter substrate-binding protein [Catenulispora pinistramenti]
MTTMNGRRHRGLRTGGVAVVVAAVALSAACSSPGGASKAVMPRPGQDVAPGGLPNAPKAPPTPCGPSATAAALNALPGPNDPVAPGGTLDKIRKRGFLIAGIDVNTELFGYDPQHNNNPQGFDVDMAKAVARAIFGADGHIQFRVVTLADPTTGEFAQLHAGNIDLAVETTTITCARMEGANRMNFSNPYYTAQLRLLMPLGDDGNPQKTSLAQLKGTGTKVCATLNSTPVDIIKKTLGDSAAVQVPNALDCLADLQQDQVGAIYTDDALLRGMASQDPHVAMTTAPGGQDQPYGIATNFDPKTPNDLTPFVNTVLANMIQDPGPNGWRSLFAKDLGSQPGSLPVIPPAYPLGS